MNVSMKETRRLTFVITLFVLVATGALAQEVNRYPKVWAFRELRAALMNQKLIAQIAFPANKRGIDLKVSGYWDQKRVTSLVENEGIGIEIGEVAVVTDVILKGMHIEIHLNGGGYGDFGDNFWASIAELGTVPTSDRDRNKLRGKRPGGSRINLRFDRDIQVEDLDAARLVAWLSPVVDTSVWESVQALPEEVREAVERGEFQVGMTKAVIFSIHGEPKDRSVNMEVDPPVERWMYQPDATTTVILTFVGGKVSKIDEI